MGQERRKEDDIGYHYCIAGTGGLSWSGSSAVISSVQIRDML